ncbi:MAG: zinc ABC transporter substrate-binding protein [Bacilli bacterium]|nr:zinc ABC transporter substrate-binding protein [Bacilli bacterium]
MKKLLALLAIFIFGGMTSACADTTIEYDVYVTVYPLQYVTEQIMEGTGLTVGIVPGVTSHSSSVDWSPKEIIAMTKATYLFYVGANYDQYIDLQINSIFEDKYVELVKLENETTYIQFILGIIDEHDHDYETEAVETTEPETSPLGYDPHFWVSPLKVQQASALIYDKLIVKFADHKTLMLENYTDLVSDLQELSSEFQTVCEAATKPVMTSTNIYGYLRHDYGFEYLSISPGYHEETEQFTSQEKEKIVQEAYDHNIHHIIYEKNITSPLSNAVFTALETKYGESGSVTKLEFDILQTITDQDRSQGKDYISIMYENLDLFKQATGYQEG